MFVSYSEDEAVSAAIAFKRIERGRELEERKKSRISSSE
jgi:hypothetical protein